MRRIIITTGLALAMLTTTNALGRRSLGEGGQRPGDRPAPNPESTRSAVLARNGVIATSQPLASAAGLRVMMEGGNAIDAAVTAAAGPPVGRPARQRNARG